MKYGDKVKVLVDKKEYLNQDIHKGEIGYVNLPEIRNGKFDVSFDIDDGVMCVKQCMMNVEDLEVVEEYNISDERLLNCLPSPDPRWWCKVENGYILNLKGEKKNKIPYDYNS